jgi:hypothetical protein
MKTMNDVTLYDLMAEDLEVWVSKNYKFGFNLQIDDENGEPLIDEDGVHPYAADSFAAFCRSYLASYDKANKQSEAA